MIRQNLYHSFSPPAIHTILKILSHHSLSLSLWHSPASCRNISPPAKNHKEEKRKEKKRKALTLAKSPNCFSETCPSKSSMISQVIKKHESPLLFSYFIQIYGVLFVSVIQ
jgi:hypothetical protein